MTLDGFLTVLTLIIAVVAIIPPITRLRLRLRWKIPAFFSVVCFILVIYLEFFEALALPCPAAFGRYCERIVITPSSIVKPPQWAFVVVLIWFGLGIWALTRRKISKSALPALSALVAELAYERRYADILPLLESALILVTASSKRRLFLMRWHDRLERLDHRKRTIEQLLEILDDAPAAWSAWEALIDRARGLIAKTAYLVPAGYAAELAAKEIIRVLFQTVSIHQYITTYRPEFGVKMLGCDVFEVHDFCDDFMTALIAMPQGVLFNEVRKNQNQSQHGYAYPEHNHLLHFLFFDCRNAEKLAVYKPIGDYVIAQIRSENADYIKYLNGPADMYSEEECWRDSSFVAIRFFDLMVTAAMWQGVRWHMWLFYLPGFMERLVAVYDDTGPDIDRFAEFPTRGSYLIWQLVSTLMDWIAAVEDLPSESPHKKIETVSVTHENGNIPKSATLALGQCLRHLLMAGNVSLRVRSSNHDSIMRRLRDLSGPDLKDIRKALINSILHRGVLGPDYLYGQELKGLFLDLDHVIRYEIPDYEQALVATYGPI